MCSEDMFDVIYILLIFWDLLFGLTCSILKNISITFEETMYSVLFV